MPQRFNLRADWLRAAIAALMTCLLLLLGLVAASERFHSQLHRNAPATHGACSVCALAKGQLDVPNVPPLRAVSWLALSWTIPAFESAPSSPPDLSAASSRGPPAFSSSL